MSSSAVATHKITSAIDGVSRYAVEFSATHLDQIVRYIRAEFVVVSSSGQRTPGQIEYDRIEYETMPNNTVRLPLTRMNAYLDRLRANNNTIADCVVTIGLNADVDNPTIFVI